MANVFVHRCHVRCSHLRSTVSPNPTACILFVSGVFIHVSVPVANLPADFVQEYLHRPTDRARWWDAPHAHVLGGRDLQAPARGTWLGVTSDGRIAVLTNFREEASGASSSTAVSRGAMVNAYLTQLPGEVEDVEAFARGLITGEGARGSGGFTLVCGQLGERLAVVSNRMTDLGDVAWMPSKGGEGEKGDDGGKVGETLGLSNAAFGDRSWKKVHDGEELMAQIVRQNAEAGGDQEDLVQKIFALLSRDTLPVEHEDEGWSTVVHKLKDSIFIPVVGGEETQYYGDEIASGRSKRRMSVNVLDRRSYGTSKQTVILVDHDKNVTFIEKTLYEDGRRVARDPETTVKYEFKISR